MKNILSFLSITFLWISAGSAQSGPDIQFEHLSMKDGLSMNPVMAILEDKKGFLWFGTQDGLNKYNGYEFRVFKSKEEDSTSISDNFITALQNDLKGNLWVGTLNGGLNYYDYKKATFKTYKNPLFNDFRIWSLLQIDNRLWIGTDRGVMIFDQEKNQFLDVYKLYPGLSRLDKTSVLYIFADSKRKIWLGTTQGLFEFNPNDNLFEQFVNSSLDVNSLSHNIVLTVFEDKAGQIWAGTIDGLNLLLPDKSFKRFYFKNSSKTVGNKGNVSSGVNIYSLINNYGGNTIRCIFEDEQSRLWIGTDMELIVFNPSTGIFVNYKKDLINPTGISDHFIRSMYVDKSKNLWIGTLGNGINKTSLNPKKFRHYQKKINNPLSLNENYVRDVCEDQDGNIWVGVLVGGLNKFDPITETFSHFIKKVDNSTGSINDNNIWSLCYDASANKLLIGTNNGLDILNLTTNKFEHFVHNKQNTAGISDNTIRNIFIDNKNRIWIGTEGGLNLFNRTTKTFKCYNKENSALSDNTIWKIVQDKRGRLWLATNDGLNEFDPDKETFVVYKKQKGNSSSLSHNSIRTLLIDKSDVLWVGTQNGLNRFDHSSRSFTRFDESSGLPNSFIYSIEQDQRHNLWLSTNKGLAKLNTVTREIATFDVYDGLQDYEFNTNASASVSNGEMYFAGPNGLNRFNPENLFSNKYSPPIEITQIKVLDKTINADTDIAELQELTLHYDQNILHFEFSSLDFTRPERNKYSYKMDGFNNNWISSGNERTTTYTNLDPGVYTFMVKGTNVDGVWSDNVRSFKITILPPFWKTKWFYTLSVFLLFAIIYLIYRARVKSLKTEKTILEKRIQERTADLEEEKRKIEEINKELEKLSIVARETDNAVIIADPSGKIEWINEGFNKMYGLLADDLNIYGQPLSKVSYNSNIDDIIKKAVLSRSSVIYESTTHNERHSKLFVQSTLTPIFNDLGELRKLVIIDSDISERKHAEEIIKEKNKDITDSINYAVRIQQALLPNKEKVLTELPDSFILFKPKDIVSGDFYFIEPIKANDGLKLTGFAVGDCTGHGVPGAFMSIIGTNFLKQSLTQKSVNTPADALEFLSEKLNETLQEQTGSTIIRDGMDIAFGVLNPLTRQMYFAGANNPLIIINDSGIKEIKGDKRAVGFSETGKPFTNHTVQLQQGDMVYFFSDGYADQFGGPHGKKFKQSRLKETLFSIHTFSAEEQKQKLSSVFYEWKGELEQLDDVCIMGVRIQ